MMKLVFSTLLLTMFLLTASATARQFLHLHDRPLIGWRCPDCGARNSSDPEGSFQAVCHGCHLGTEWSHILPKSDDIAAALAIAR